VTAIIAVCGLAGAGKTTSVDVLERLGEGARVYVGAFVTAEVERRGLSATPQNERQVRQELREKGGMDALARMALPTISGIIDAGRVALVDAIYCAEEFELYLTHFGDSVVRVALETRRGERERRLSVRNLRPISAEALASRDEFELVKLGLGRVMAEAEHSLENNGSLDDLENSLKQLAVALRD
jgi:dephospho-CoA kinase